MNETFTEAIEKSLRDHAGEPWKNGLKDLGEIAERLNVAVGAVTHGMLGTGLAPFKDCSANIQGNINYDLVLLDITRTKILERIDRFSLQPSGHYPVLVVSVGTVAFGIGDRDGLEARFMAHIKTWQSRLIIKIQEALKA